MAGIDNGPTSVAVPMEFAGMDILVQATAARVIGTQPTSAADRVADAYLRAEPAIIRIASSVGHTISKLAQQSTAPREVTVDFGLAITLEGDVVVVRGKAEATIAITLTYDAAH